MATKTTKTASKAQTNGTNGHKKTVCPLTKAEFVSKAKPLAVSIDGRVEVAGVKEFSTGSFGWHFNGKTVVVVDGVPVSCQANVLLTAIGSKPE